MKRGVSIFGLTLLALFSFFSCKKNNMLIDQENENFQVQDVKNDNIDIIKGDGGLVIKSRALHSNTLLKNIDKFIEDNKSFIESFQSDHSIFFDFSDDYSIVDVNYTQAKALMFKSSDYRYCISFYVDENDILKNVLFIEYIIKDNINIKYFNIDQSIFAKLVIDKNTGNLIMCGVNSSNRNKRDFKEWGYRTSDCLKDVYDNHGWASILAVGSGPYGFVAFGITCAIRNSETLSNILSEAIYGKS